MPVYFLYIHQVPFIFIVFVMSAMRTGYILIPLIVHSTVGHFFNSLFYNAMSTVIRPLYKRWLFVIYVD